MLEWESTKERGDYAERAAEMLLRRRGYRILERQHRNEGGEIDLIAQHRDVLCFIEVKARWRDDFGGAECAIDHRKKQRVRRAAQIYLSRLPVGEQEPFCRFDVVLLRPAEEEPERLVGAVLRNAFQ